RAVVLALTLIASTSLGTTISVFDNSDWWSLLRETKPEACLTPSKKKPDGANFVIAGVDFRNGDAIEDAERKIAKPWAISSRGDASTGREQIGFKSAAEGGRFKLIFERGEIASAAYLIDGGPDW